MCNSLYVCRLCGGNVANIQVVTCPDYLVKPGFYPYANPFQPLLLPVVRGKLPHFFPVLDIYRVRAAKNYNNLRYRLYDFA